MIYHDRVYGKVKITEPIILALIKSKAIQRLKYIDWGGYRKLYTNPRLLSQKLLKINRFEHSVGVFILLRKFNASLEEQIAGLVHDTSHGIFSHALDYLFARGHKQDYGDRIFNNFFKKSEIPKILRKYSFEPNHFLNIKSFSLLEKNLPDLCADRIDNFLRLISMFKESNQKTINYFLKSLCVKDSNWFFSNFKIAKNFSNLYLKMYQIYVSDIESAVMFNIISRILKLSLRKKYLIKNDLFKTDQDALRKIKKNLKKDIVLNNLFTKMKGKVKFKNDPKDYDYHEFVKSRVVDPLFRGGGKLKHISEVDKKWKKIVEEGLKPKEYYLKFL
jgi:uncharacterized protein